MREHFSDDRVILHTQGMFRTYVDRSWVAILESDPGHYALLDGVLLGGGDARLEFLLHLTKLEIAGCELSWNKRSTSFQSDKGPLCFERSIKIMQDIGETSDQAILGTGL